MKPSDEKERGSRQFSADSPLGRKPQAGIAIYGHTWKVVMNSCHVVTGKFGGWQIISNAPKSCWRKD